ncbi:MAG: hypothetical protein ABS889_03800 [Desemzia incerta]
MGLSLSEPYLSQERKIKEKIKFHKNEIERLQESIGDIYYNSNFKQNEAAHRKVYGIDGIGETDTILNTRAIEVLSGIVESIKVDISGLQTQINAATKKEEEK